MEKLGALFEMGDEPDRRPILEQLIKCSEDHGVPILNIPVIAKVPLDLYRFYKVVYARGGYIEVCLRLSIFSVFKSSLIPLFCYSTQDS
jgi:hypothetical protein